MATFKNVTPLCMMLLVFILCVSVAQSQITINLCPGPRSPPEQCPIACLVPDPVCGANGVTYWCGCPDALCSGARVVKFGEC
ncbi:hypothetical protein DITRI_Ditri11bG0006600 [Diplodiscus trichospermus]